MGSVGRFYSKIRVGVRTWVSRLGILAQPPAIGVGGVAPGARPQTFLLGNIPLGSVGKAKNIPEWENTGRTPTQRQPQQPMTPMTLDDT